MPLIIAEISANHGNSIEIVKDSIIAAKESGANAVKIQTYKPESITIDCDSEDFVIRDESLWKDSKLFDLYKKGSMPYEWTKELFDFARDNDILLFSTPFDELAVDLLESVNNPIYKVASFEINHIPLLQKIAKTKKPVIISTGIATEEEILLAVNTFKEAGVTDITLLKCTSQYPAKIEDANLNMMNYFKDKFNVRVGISDHTIGSMVPIVGITLGATVIEKHFILNKEIDSPDKDFSMDPAEFKEMVDKVTQALSTLGIVSFDGITEKPSRKYRRSIYVSNDVKKGDIVTTGNIKVVRPGFGLDPKFYFDLLGKEFDKDYKKGDRITKVF
ncbi:MAG: pseudaminic acid synthase [Anaerorhabdus sp.]